MNRGVGAYTVLQPGQQGFRPDVFPAAGQAPFSDPFQREIVQAAPLPAIPIPQMLVPWLEAAANKAAIATVLNKYGEMYSSFWYSRTAMTLNIGATLTNQVVQLNTDSHFIMTGILYRTNLAAGAVLDTRLDLRMGSSSSILTSAAAPIQSIATVLRLVTDTASPPWEFSRPIVWAPGGTILFDLLDGASAANQTCDVTFSGYKFYHGARPGFDR